MRANSLLLVALITLTGFGAGMIIGGHLASTKAATVRSPSARLSAETQGSLLPAIKRHPKTGGSGTTASQREPTSVAEIEAEELDFLEVTGKYWIDAVKDGDYTWTIGLYGVGDGARLSLEGIDDGHSRIVLGVIHVRENGASVT